jgi:hypothetical protein
MIRKMERFCPELIRYLVASENRQDILKLMKDCLFEYGKVANEAIQILIWMAPWGYGELDHVSLDRMIEFAGSGFADPDIGPLIFHGLRQSVDLCLHNVDYYEYIGVLDEAMVELVGRWDVEIDA